MIQRTLFIFLLTSLALVACKNDNDKKATKAAGSVVQASNLQPETQDDHAITPDRYTSIPFGKLSKEQRATFVKVAKAELCPCDGSTVSLDECLKEKEQACQIAKWSAHIAMDSIQRGRNETDVLADMTQAIELIKTRYKFSLDDRPFIGAENAKVKVVEFADYRCPHCARASELLNKLSEKYKDKSVAFYYKNFLLDEKPLGINAMSAAVAAGKQGKFWEMHNLIFDNQSSLNDQKFQDFAKKIGLNLKKFNIDRESEETKSFIQTDNKEGLDASVQGTPTIFINGRRFLESPEDLDALSSRIDSELK